MISKLLNHRLEACNENCCDALGVPYREEGQKRWARGLVYVLCDVFMNDVHPVCQIVPSDQYVNHAVRLLICGIRKHAELHLAAFAPPPTDS